jgi:hypothetical protein
LLQLALRFIPFLLITQYIWEDLHGLEHRIERRIAGLSSNARRYLASALW